MSGQDPIHGLPLSLRSDMRFFAFYIGNGTLMVPSVADIELDYFEALGRRGPLLGGVFAVWASVSVLVESGVLPERSPKVRAAAWLRRQIEPAYVVDPPFDPREIAADGAGAGWAEEVIRFARDLGEGTLEPSILGHLDYVPSLTGHGHGAGSELEMLFAILGNVLRVDGEGRVTNAAHARLRAAQYVRSLVDADYRPEPKFTAEETALWL